MKASLIGLNKGPTHSLAAKLSNAPFIESIIIFGIPKTTAWNALRINFGSPTKTDRITDHTKVGIKSILLNNKLKAPSITLPKFNVTIPDRIFQTSLNAPDIASNTTCIGPKISDNISVPSVNILRSSVPAPINAPIPAAAGMLIPAVKGANKDPIDAPAAAPHAAPPATPKALSAVPPCFAPIIGLKKLPVLAPPVSIPNTPPSRVVRPASFASIAPFTPPKASINGPTAFPTIGPNPLIAPPIP